MTEILVPKGPEICQPCLVIEFRLTVCNNSIIATTGQDRLPQELGSPNFIKDSYGELASELENVVLVLRFIFRGDSQPSMFVQTLKLGHDTDVLQGVPRNEPPAFGSYVCIVAVKDYWRMRIGEARKAGEWHYRQLEVDIVRHTREGRCVIVFDLSNEGPAYDVDTFDELLNWIEAERIPPKHTVWLSQNRAIALTCENREPIRSKLIQFEYYDSFVKKIAWTFQLSSEKIFGDSLEAAILSMFDVSNKTSTLLCLNASPRVHRVLALAALQENGLFGEALISFPGLSYPKDSISAQAIFEFVDHRPQLHHLRSVLAKITKLERLKVDQFQDIGNDLYDKISISPYQHTFFSLVTETEMTNGSVLRITEKSVKAFCLGHPALILGNPFSVSFLTEWGFQDWDGFIDRSAESETDAWVRFDLVIKEVARQAASIKRDPVGWLGAASEIGAKNIHHAAGGGFLTLYKNLYDRPLVGRLQHILHG